MVSAAHFDAILLGSPDWAGPEESAQAGLCEVAFV